MLQLAVADGSRANDQAAIANGFFDGIVFFGFRQKRRGTNRGNRLAKGLFVRRDHTQMKRAEIAHRACGRADIERIARAHQDDAQVLEIGRIFQLFHRSSAGPPGGVSILREARRAAAKSRC